MRNTITLYYDARTGEPALWLESNETGAGWDVCDASTRAPVASWESCDSIRQQWLSRCPEQADHVTEEPREAARVAADGYVRTVDLFGNVHNTFRRENERTERQGRMI